MSHALDSLGRKPCTGFFGKEWRALDSLGRKPCTGFFGKE